MSQMTAMSFAAGSRALGSSRLDPTSVASRQGLLTPRSHVRQHPGSQAFRACVGFMRTGFLRTDTACTPDFRRSGLSHKGPRGPARQLAQPGVLVLPLICAPRRFVRNHRRWTRCSSTKCRGEAHWNIGPLLPSFPPILVAGALCPQYTYIMAVELEAENTRHSRG